MITIEPTASVLGARLRGIDVTAPLSQDDLATVAAAITRYGVICIPGQKLDATSLRAFASQLGEMQVSEGIKDPDVQQISVLSNIVENGRNIGALDAGMIWHKDMTYQKNMGWLTALYGLKIPRRDGRPLGATRFASGAAAYADLSDERKAKLESAIGVHDSVMYNAKVRDAGSKRAAYTGEKAARKPQLPHPIVYPHPISGKPVLYCDPGHVARIDGLPEDEAEEMLAFLSEHQLELKYQYVHEWAEGDLLMWDNMATLHRATLDYGPDELRLMKRCQVVTPFDAVKTAARAKLQSASAAA